MLVKKVINGKIYYYYQDYRSPRLPPITTYIGEEQNLRSPLPFIKHLTALLQRENTKFYFENRPTKPFDVNLPHLLKTVYRFAESVIPRTELEEVKTGLFVQYVHSTTAIEGITLNLGETKSLLSDLEMTPLNKPFSDSQAVLNYKQVKKYMDDYHGELDNKFIKRLNLCIMFNLKDEKGNPIKAGEYRSDNTRGIPGVGHSRWQEISEDLDSLILWYYSKKQHGLHPIELAARFHQQFEEIHPFADGNGRTGRAILDFMLKQEGYPMIFIPVNQREEYLSALRRGNRSNKRSAHYVPLIDFIIKRLLYTLSYLASKTGFFDILQSARKDESFMSIFSAELFNDLFHGLESYHESDEAF